MSSLQRGSKSHNAEARRAEMALRLAPLAAPVLVGDLGLVHAQVFEAGHLEGRSVAHEVDGVAPAARRLAADRAIAELVGNRRVALDRERNGAAAAGAAQ